MYQTGSDYHEDVVASDMSTGDGYECSCGEFFEEEKDLKEHGQFCDDFVNEFVPEQPMMM